MQPLPKIEAGLKQQWTSSSLLQAKHCATSKAWRDPFCGAEMQKHLQAEDRAQTQKNLLATQTPHSAKGKSSPTPGKEDDHSALRTAAVAHTRPRSAPYGTESSPRVLGEEMACLFIFWQKVLFTSVSTVLHIMPNI